MANRDTGLWSKLQERLKQPVKDERPAADARRDVTAKVRKVAGELRRRNQTAAKTTRAAAVGAAVKESKPMKRQTKMGTKKRPTRTAAKAVRAGGRKTAKRPATAAYSRTARVGRNEDTQLEIEARVDEAARIRGEIEAKIDRGLEARPEVRSRPMGWLSR